MLSKSLDLDRNILLKMQKSNFNLTYYTYVEKEKKLTTLKT